MLNCMKDTTRNITSSQGEISKARMERFGKLKTVKNLCEIGKQVVYSYGSLAIKEAYEARKKESKIPIFDAEYMPDFTEYQYDMEMFIFLNYEKLYKRELELAKGEKLALHERYGIKFGATFLTRQEHLQNAILIRFPEKELPTGEISTAYALTPWAKDFLYGISNYTNVVTFGGGGQGKTFSAIVFMVMLYDHFIYTKSGAQCSFSTVSETKLRTSIWSHLNKVYNWKPSYKYSKYGNQAVQAGDYTFCRKNAKGKRLEEGGTMKGILLVNSPNNARQVDKLTGQHDVKARAYLLDEAQSTGQAPMQAYNNMFLHPEWGWMFMAGNYEKDEDLLGINTIPDSPNGWNDVNETTHMWEGELKSLDDGPMGHKSLVIHYNNDLSPAIYGPHNSSAKPGSTAGEMKRKYGKFLPTVEKRAKVCPPGLDNYGKKRFWIGFRFEKVSDDEEKVITIDILKTFGAAQKQDFKTMFVASSFDPAHSSDRDRNLLSFFNIGLNDKGYPMFSFAEALALGRPSSALQYYKDTSIFIKEAWTNRYVDEGCSIVDWTQRSGILEECSKLGVVFHPMIYSQKPPDEVKLNEITKIAERPIEMEVVQGFSGGFEKTIKTYAHEKFMNRITMGAYCLRLYVEAGMWRGINASLFNNIPDAKTFEEEMCLRYFKWSNSRNPMMMLDEKSEFKKKRKFSPDVLDTLFQFCYMAWVIFDIRPGKPGLGNLKKKEIQKPVDNSRWDAKLRFRGGR